MHTHNQHRYTPTHSVLRIITQHMTHTHTHKCTHTYSKIEFELVSCNNINTNKLKFVFQFHTHKHCKLQYVLLYLVRLNESVPQQSIQTERSKGNYLNIYLSSTVSRRNVRAVGANRPKNREYFSKKTIYTSKFVFIVWQRPIFYRLLLLPPTFYLNYYLYCLDYSTSSFVTEDVHIGYDVGPSVKVPPPHDYTNADQMTGTLVYITMSQKT